MFRFCRRAAPSRSKITSFLLATGAAGAGLACMDDPARVMLSGVPSEPGQDTAGGTEPAVGEAMPPAGVNSDAVNGAPAAPDETPRSSATAQTIGSVAVPAGVPPADGCWQLPLVNRARLLAPDGRAASLVGGKIV